MSYVFHISSTEKDSCSEKNNVTNWIKYLHFDKCIKKQSGWLCQNLYIFRLIPFNFLILKQQREIKETMFMKNKSWEMTILSHGVSAFEILVSVATFPSKEFSELSSLLLLLFLSLASRPSFSYCIAGLALPMRLINEYSTRSYTSIMIIYVSVNWENVEQILKFKTLFSSKVTQCLPFQPTIYILKNTKLNEHSK